MKTTRDIILAIVLTLAMLGQIAATIVFYDQTANAAIINTGWFILWISAIFGVLPIQTFRKWGKVPKGKGYMHTTALVDQGVYAVVRHPQYLAGILIGLALPLITQHWLVALLGVVVIVVTYINTYDEEKYAIEKFGDEYRQYMQRVPRVNFLLGIYRLIVKRK
jgi:protein-S-isoprenylcysteine O-methyltransferase Ste14